MFDRLVEAEEELAIKQMEINELKKTVKALTEVIAQLYFKYVPDGTEVRLRKVSK